MGESTLRASLYATIAVTTAASVAMGVYLIDPAAFSPALALGKLGGRIAGGVSAGLTCLALMALARFQKGRGLAAMALAVALSQGVLIVSSALGRYVTTGERDVLFGYLHYGMMAVPFALFALGTPLFARGPGAVVVNGEETITAGRGR